MFDVPQIRQRTLNDSEINDNGDYVLYWMIANRRTRSNFSLQKSIALATSLGKPLVILEALRVNYKWASDRIHRFVMQGMAAQKQNFANSPITYYPYVEPEKGHARGLLEALADRACLVVTDDFPCFFIPRMLRITAKKLSVPLIAIDSNGLYPMYATDKVFPLAHSFRRHLQKELLEHLEQFPLEHPLKNLELPRLDEFPPEITARWPEVTEERLQADPEQLAKFQIDHSVRAAAFDGGETVALETLQDFLMSGLSRYADDRNHPDTDASSGLSPYLHFGHISSHTIFTAIANQEGWSPAKLSSKASGSRNGWWGMSDAAEGFLDELITWREVGYNRCALSDDYDKYESLPDWAQATLAEHSQDSRPVLYSQEELEHAETHDPVWNAAQRQLVTEGRMHNYLRMLWGKKILEWSPTPQIALEVMIHLNNKYAVDGRNPNSYSGIFWVLGRYDRAWGPERPIYGKIRYMTSDSTKRKLNMKRYLQQFSKSRSDSRGRLFPDES